MKTWLLVPLALALGGLVLSDVGRGHGGSYRGPGDFVPPGGGGGGGGSGPSVPGPSGPGAGPSGAAGPGVTGSPGPGQTGGLSAAGAHAARTGDAIELAAAPTGWSFWWEFNKDPYLNLKDAIHATVKTGTTDFFLGSGQQDQARDTRAPTRGQIRDVVVPALLQALEKERSNDIVTGCLVALAKIGDDTNESGDSRFGAVIEPFLADSSQEIRETAAIALGILAHPSSVDVLLDLVRDTAHGRALVDDSEVDYRTRAFAAYGLGLVGSRLQEDDVVTSARIVEALTRLLREGRSSTRDIEVACLQALGLVPLPDVSLAADAAEQPEAAWSSRSGQIEFLLGMLGDESLAPLTRAHAPTAIVRLMRDLSPDRRAELVERVTPAFLAPLRPRSKARNELKQSCVLALGVLGDADADELDVAIREALMSAPEDHRDQQVRAFSMVALGHAGGRAGVGEERFAGLPSVEAHLLKQLAKGKSELRAWAAMGLGVLGRTLEESGADVPRDLCTALRAELEGEKNPERVGAFSVALGILRDADAAELLLKTLDSIRDDEARGYVALALGMTGTTGAIDDIQRVVRESKYRPKLLRQAAIALGLLGDKRVVGTLTDMLRDAKGLSTQAAISSALGFIGDADSIVPLVGMLADEQLTDGARGFAAVALGIVADREPLPWNSRLAVDVNYRAATATLNDVGGTGVLNIL